jgi:hypothetical protein
MQATTAASNRMEFLMSIKTKIAAAALAILAVTGGIASTTQSAEARGLGFGIGAGLVGAAIVGSAIAASSDGYYYDGYRHCGWVRQFDAYGNFIGRVRSCNY